MTTRYERREYARIPHRAHATLNTAERAYPTHLLNISSKGALIAVIDEHRLSTGQDITLQIDGDDGSFELVGQIVHMNDHYIGLDCAAIDDESEIALAALIRESEGGSAPLGLLGGLDSF